MMNATSHARFSQTASLPACGAALLTPHRSIFGGDGSFYGSGDASSAEAEDDDPFHMSEWTHAPAMAPSWSPTSFPTEQDEHGRGGRGGYGGGNAYASRFDGDDTASYYVS
jgi:hypothetical protein